MEAPVQIPAGEASVSYDKRLVAEVLAKDHKATAEFVVLCADAVYPFVRRRLMPNTASVDDLTQEILLTAWQNLEGFRGDSRLRTWILGITRHKVEDYYHFANQVARTSQFQERASLVRP
jgi:RNA polymerase sigma-70 factor (ECF subfamily)